MHVNGFKISERTIYGTMDDKEITALFTGYGYQVRFVEDLDNIDQDLAASLQWALSEIHKIQKDARSGKPQVKPRWPVLIMRTPKVSRCASLFVKGPAELCMCAYRDGADPRSSTASSSKAPSVLTKYLSLRPRPMPSNVRCCSTG